MKKQAIIFFSFILLLCILVGFCGCQKMKNNEEEAVRETVFKFTLKDDDTYEVNTKKCTTDEVTIPAQHLGKPVTSIGERAFKNSKWLTSIIIPDSVTSIKDEAFRDCMSLTNVSIPDSLTFFGDRVFTGCDNLNCSVYDNAKYLGNADNPYVVLKEVASMDVDSCVIHANTIFIGSYSFAECHSLASVTIPAGVKSIGEYAFYDCYPASVYYTGDVASWCKINFDLLYSNPVMFSSELYIDNELVTDLVIPDGMTKIGFLTFAGCQSLTSVTIPDSVTSIEIFAFYGCINLRSVTIGSRVTEIGEFAFGECYKLFEVYNKSDLDIAIGDYHHGYVGYYARDVYVEPFESKFYADANGFVLYRDETELVLVEYSGAETELTLPSGVTQISQYAFVKCNNMTSVVIPDTVRSIGRGAFSGCKCLTSITIPDSVKMIGDSAFSRCSGLTNFFIGSGVESIGDRAFSGCEGLTSITIPDNVTIIGESTFYDCGGLTGVSIGSGVERIGDWVFFGCSSLKNIDIPDNVTSIGEYAFSNCIGLTNVVIPDSVTSIGNYAFHNCSGLLSVTFGSGVESIGEKAFADCHKLVEVYNRSPLTIQKGRTAYGYVGCYAKVIYTETYETKLSVDENGYILYRDGTGVILMGYTGTETELTLPSGITEIYRYALYRNNEITSVSIPDSVTSIGDYAFRSRGSLTEIAYAGTKMQWGAVKKSSCWNLSIGGQYTIRCTDGDIRKS